MGSIRTHLSHGTVKTFLPAGFYEVASLALAMVNKLAATMEDQT
jgi:hypothetical protein